jgi:hypothetical protein
MMVTMWDIKTETVGDIINYVDQSTIGLPQFQRLSVWGKKDWVPFLKTLLLNRPTGTLLLLEAGLDSSEFAPRHIDGGPPLGATNLKWLLLDGQQRSTTVYRAFQIGFDNAGPTKEFVLDVKSALARGELLEEDLELVNAAKVGVPSAMAGKGKIALRTLINNAQRTAWLNSYVQHHLATEPDGLVTLITQLEEIIPAFSSVSSYRFPVLEIKNTTPLDVVVDIFEGMNRRGQKLNQFDLMVARLYKDLGNGSYYDLRKKYEDCLDNSPNLKKLGLNEDDGMLPLQLIAIQFSRLPQGAKFAHIKGLSNKDVLELPAEQIIGTSGPNRPYPNLDFDAAMNALENAADFLNRICGVRSGHLLPQQSMLLPIADQFLLDSSARLSEANMKRWFYTVGLKIDYYGGVNSYAARDCKALYEWASNPTGKIPAYITSLNSQDINQLDLKQPMTREGAILGTTIMALLVANGAKDWVTGQKPIQQLPGSVEFHHMVPDKTLKAFFKSKLERSPIANFAPIMASTNASLGDTNPALVIGNLLADANAILATHHVDPKLLAAAPNNVQSFEALLVDREIKLKKFIISSLGL